MQPDSTVFRQGRGSLRLTLADDEERLFVYLYTSAFALDSLRGQLVTVSAWVRTRGFRGRAGLYAFANAATTGGPATDRVDAVDSLPADQDWRRLELRLPVRATAGGFGVGLRAWGNGRVWFDDVQVRVGGHRLADAPQPGTEALLLTAAEALTPNWDFERPLPRAARPDPARATATSDSAGPQHGRRYLRLLSLPPPGRRAGWAPTPYLGTLPLSPAQLGKTLQVKGFWRRAGPGGASPDSTLAFGYVLLSQEGPGSRACYALLACLASMIQAKMTKWSCCRVLLKRS